MSASDKKKLRKELNNAALTEKQKKEQQEARKLKAYTLTFAIVMILVVAIVVGVVVTPLIEGAISRNSHAVNIGEHKLSAAELTYFYKDAISEYQEKIYNQYYEQFGNYWTIALGFDPDKALDEQDYVPTGEDAKDDSIKTWADYFINKAIENAKDMYSLYDEANAQQFKLDEEAQKEMDTYFDSLDMYASYYGYSSVKSYLRSNYGVGATEEGYRTYYSVCEMASAFLQNYADKLEYKTDDYRAYEAAKLDEDKFDRYATVSYVTYSMDIESYYPADKKAADLSTEEKDAARTALKSDMEQVLKSEIKDKESFDKAIQALAVNQKDKDGKELADDKKPTATEKKYQFFEGMILHAGALEWLKSADSKAGDVKAFEVYSYPQHEDANHEHGDDCGCARTTDGYTIVLLTNRYDNKVNMANVRHILVEFKANATDADKQAAKAEAEKLLQQWKDGTANEDSFAELANKESDDQDGKVTNGGLYEDIGLGQMVEPFEDWCFAEGRKAGDTGIVETVYGYHVMYYSSTDVMTYRDFLIENDLRTEDTEKWHDGLVEKLAFEIVSLDNMEYDFVLNG